MKDENGFVDVGRGGFIFNNNIDYCTVTDQDFSTMLPGITDTECLDLRKLEVLE